MKISPVRISGNFNSNCSKKYVSKNKDVNKDSFGFDACKTGFCKNRSSFYIPFLNFKANIKENFKDYTPVASIVPKNDYIGNYDNLDRFCELYTEKINSNLLVPTEFDICNLISKIKKDTGADERLIKNVLYDLSKYSTYKSFPLFEMIISDFKIKSFGLAYKDGKFDFSSNGAINYLVNSKKFVKYPESHDKIGFILDDSSLSLLEKYKNSMLPFEKEAYINFLKDVYEDKVVFINLKGWDIKTNNDGYKNSNFFSGTGYLYNLAVDTIKKIQNGEKAEDIYFSDFKKRLYDVIGEKTVQEHINIRKFALNDNLINISNNDILKQITPLKLDKDYVKKVITAYLDVKQTSNPEKQNQEALLKYLDEMSIVYSVDSLAVALKKIGKNIESALKRDGYSKDKTMYVVPAGLKSYSLIVHMYAMVNDIKPENILSLSSLSYNSDCAKVILDDLSASGASESEACYNANLFSLNDKTPLLYAAVTLCSQAENNNERTDNSQPNQYYFDKYQNDMSEVSRILYVIKMHSVPVNFEYDKNDAEELISKKFKLLNYEDCRVLNDLLFKGYNSSALSIAFPYMIPDNASDISSLLFDRLLQYKNSATNKPKGLLLSGKRRDYEDECRQFRRIINKIEI